MTLTTPAGRTARFAAETPTPGHGLARVEALGTPVGARRRDGAGVAAGPAVASWRGRSHRLPSRGPPPPRSGEPPATEPASSPARPGVALHRGSLYAGDVPCPRAGPMPVVRSAATTRCLLLCRVAAEADGRPHGRQV